MPEANQTLGMYLHLAQASARRGQPMVRVKLLVLAGVQAQQMGLEEIAALCRHRVLAHNAQHLIRRWPSFEEALDDDQFLSYLKQLRRRYSSEKIEHMLQSLGIEMGRERQAYFSDSEYAAALLDAKVDAIAEILATAPTRSAKFASATRNTRRGNSTTRLRGLPSTPPLSWRVVWGPFVAGLVGLAAAVWAAMYCQS